MKSVLILGSSGMLGQGVISALINYNDINLAVTVRNKKKLDEFKKRKLFNKVKKIFVFDVNKIKDHIKIKKIFSKYNYIINCIGVIKPEINQMVSSSIRNAIYINSIFPSILSNSLKNNKIKIFQIATDCVFSGNEGSYIESSKHDDLDIYGISKSIGEIKSKNFYNLRTSIIGREYKTKKSLLEWFLNQNENKINGFDNHKWNGVTTNIFGEIIYAIIKNNIKIPNNLHIVPKNTVTKYQLLNLFKKKFKTKTKIKKYKAKSKVDRSLSTVHLKIVDKIWNKTILKKRPTIDEMIERL